MKCVALTNGYHRIFVSSDVSSDIPSLTPQEMTAGTRRTTHGLAETTAYLAQYLAVLVAKL